MHAPEGGDAELNLTPLLDVVLQLIMFFLITVNFERQDRFSGVTLPEVQNAKPIDAKSKDRPEHDSDNWIYLNMTKDGTLVVPNVKSLNYEGIANNKELRGVLGLYLREQRDKMERNARYGKKPPEWVRPVIVLRADKEVPFDNVYDILEMCTEAGFRSWQLRVMHKPAEKK